MKSMARRMLAQDTVGDADAETFLCQPGRAVAATPATGLCAMTSTPPVLEPSFLAIQRTRLVAMRTDLLRTMRREAEEALQVQSAGERHAHAAEDIDRALAKLDEGTYGISDVSGVPIPFARLQAYPQAVRTSTEESGSRRPAP